jgi:hypothetical protein
MDSAFAAQDIDAKKYIMSQREVFLKDINKNL